VKSAAQQGFLTKGERSASVAHCVAPMRKGSLLGRIFLLNGMKEIKRRFARCLPDWVFINLLYRKRYGNFPNLTNPRTFDEKLQWYKLYYHDPLMTTLTDKYTVRGHLAKKGFAGILNELYGLYSSPDEIDFSQLPKRFVIKATHGSNMNLICNDKATLDWGRCCATMDKWLKTSHYMAGREWAYKHIKPRLICEKYLENEEFKELIDYKFYCYNNKPEVLFVCTGRFSPEGVKYNAYDMGWNRIYTYKGKPESDLVIEKPANLDEMVRVAGELCKGFPFIRVDLYSVKEEIIFGELTFYPDSGICPFTPDRYNYYFGDFFVLPEKKR
jgi:hypothetical protein